MSANLDMTDGRANIAFLGSRNDVWHRQGQEMKPGMSIDMWAKEAGLDHEVVKAPAYAHLEDAVFSHLDDQIQRVNGKSFLVRTDNGKPLGYVSNRYKIVQPREVFEWFQRYIGVDDRFQLDVAGSLGQGEVIWATATFRENLAIAGDEHVARLLMTTTYDGSGATLNQGTTTRVVCNNTLDIAVADKRSVIRTRHNTAFDAEKVSKELAAIAQGFAAYKAMGEAMAQHQMARDQIQSFFEAMLDIKEDVKLTTRKKNQLQQVEQAYETTLNEGAQRNSAWAALQAITRYVDHDRLTKGGDKQAFVATQFGSGKQIKDKAVADLKSLMAA